MADVLESPSGAVIGLDRQASIVGASIPAASTSGFTLAVPGARLGAMVIGSPIQSLQAGLVIGGFRVSAADQVTVTIGNVTAGPIVPTNYTFDLLVLNP